MEPPVTKSGSTSTKQEGRGRHSAPKSPVASHAVVEYQRTGFRIGIDTFSHCLFLRFGQRPGHGRIGLHNVTAPAAGTDHCGALAKRERSHHFAVTCPALAAAIALQDWAMLATMRPSFAVPVDAPRLSSGFAMNSVAPGKGWNFGSETLPRTFSETRWIKRSAAL